MALRRQIVVFNALLSGWQNGEQAPPVQLFSRKVHFGFQFKTSQHLRLQVKHQVLIGSRLFQLVASAHRPLKQVKLRIAFTELAFAEICSFHGPVMVTDWRTSATLPPSNTTRLNETFAVRLVVVSDFWIGMTKLKVVSAFGSRVVLFWPITHCVDCPTIWP